MPALGLVRKSFVSTGIITGPGAPTVKAEYSTVSVINDTVSTHGEAPHIAATIATGSTSVRANGKFVAVQDLSTTSCSHKVDTGAISVFVGR